MKNTEYDGYLGPRLSRDLQLKRLQRVIDQELTELQRRTVEGYYLEKKSMSELAQERGVNRSTVCRTLQRAERRMRRCLRSGGSWIVGSGAGATARRGAGT